MSNDDSVNNNDMTRRDFIKITAGTAACVSLGTFSFYGIAAAASGPKVTRYPIASNVITTGNGTLTFDKAIKGLRPIELSQVSKYRQFGYGAWRVGEPLPHELRTDIMPAGYDAKPVTKKAKLLNFFAITDIHITDKESPSQLIYLQQLNNRDAMVTSIYSPVMLYTTHVLDAAIQTVNALHNKNPIDFGISLGDTCNSTQYNETRWYIDVLDGRDITPSSGAHLGADKIDYQKPFKAAGLDKSIPWYQTLGNHDHFWLGSIPQSEALRKSYVGNSVLAAGDVLADPRNISKPDYYMGVLDGSTATGEIVGAGPVGKFKSPPKVTADPARRPLSKTEWIKEFSKTTTSPIGHGFNLVDPDREKGFACYSFVPKSTVPLKVIVLDNTQREDDGSKGIHGHGFLDLERWDWLKKELAAGQSAGQLMIIAAHIPIGVESSASELGWWDDAQNAVTFPDLITELHNHPNLLMWIAGHRHVNTVKAFVSPDPVSTPEKGFWMVETSSLRDFPQQFRIFGIHLNSDYTISIVTTNVDPAVKEGTPAAKSRYYAVAAQQIVNTQSIYQTPSTLPDPTIRPMPTGSYNAELVKQLSPDMKAKMQKYGNLP